MSYRSTLRGESFVFADLRELMAKANERKSGDELAGIAADSEVERVAAKVALADVVASDLVAHPLVEDAVTAMAETRHDLDAFATIASLTIGELRELILSRAFVSIWDGRAGHPVGLKAAFTPEIAAGVAKLMSDKDLVLAAAPLRNVTRCRNTLGGAGVFAVRTQPNHPRDDLEGILTSALDGLVYGCGDAVIGVNPSLDSVSSLVRTLEGLQAFVRHLAIPTQTCVLAHVTAQLAALERGAPVDLLFQSVAGTEAANLSFGVTAELLSEGREAVLAQHKDRSGEFIGEQVMYFETGQGSALSADAHQGVDQLTVEARAQGFAAAFDPFLVNTVVGFIGPEYLADARQIIRAGLEDHFVGKLLGLPMGCDVCYTNHADADQNSNDDLLVLLGAAGCNYVMGVPAGDDVMLNYQSTSFHDAASIRQLFRLRPAPEFEGWLEAKGLWRDGSLVDCGDALRTSLASGVDTSLRAGRPELAAGR